NAAATVALFTRPSSIGFAMTAPLPPLAVAGVAKR
ncbi:CRISPR-associated protein Cas5, partial [uncultured Adlercreutzia sp.]